SELAPACVHHLAFPGEAPSELPQEGLKRVARAENRQPVRDAIGDLPDLAGTKEPIDVFGSQTSDAFGGKSHGATSSQESRTELQGEKAFSTFLSAGVSPGKWRSRTVLIVLSRIHSMPTGEYTSSVKSVVKKRSELRRREAMRMKMRNCVSLNAMPGGSGSARVPASRSTCSTSP